MPLSLHESHHVKISCDPTTSSPAPVHEGQRHGYFNDEATRRLLGLDEGAVPLHAGTYGEAEPGIKPVKLSSLRDKSYDRLLLPFVPKNHWVRYTPISIYEKLQQYAVHLEARRELGRLFSKALVDVQLSMKNTGLDLPSYAHHLVPRLLYKAGGDEEPFFYQFLIFFSPSAHRIRAARIGRVCAMLDALSNLAQALQRDPGEWEKGFPIGIEVDLEELTEEDQTLLVAYRSLDVPVEGPIPDNLPSLASAEQARVMLFGKSKGRATGMPEEVDLPERDDDALFFADIQPDHDEQGFNADGRRKSAAERREFAEEEYVRELQEAQEAREEPVAMDIDPAPPYSPAEPPTSEPFGTSALQVSLGETGSNVGTPQQALTPVSAVTSIQSSEGASAFSSGSAASVTREGNQPHKKSTVAAQRSRNWRGRPRQPSPRDRRSPSRHRSPPLVVDPPRLVGNPPCSVAPIHLLAGLHPLVGTLLVAARLHPVVTTVAHPLLVPRLWPSTLKVCWQVYQPELQ